MNYNMKDTTLKIGQRDLDMTQFEVPKKIVILSSKLNHKYTELNGEKVKTEEITTIVCTALDADKVKV
ncbi:hypothetical protein ACJBSP_11675, partial [Streptococcus suis]